MNNLLKIKVSYQDHFWADIKERYLISILKEIKGETHGTITNFLRGLYFNGDKENYGLYKRKLPVVTFCSSFESERSKAFIKKYNFLVVLDIDEVGKSELERIKLILLKDIYVFSFWESPSKDGIKGLVHINYEFDINEFGLDLSHKIAFQQLVEYFLINYNIILDKCCNDYTRLCFISQDRDLVLKDKYDSFHIEYKPLIYPINKTINNAKKVYNHSCLKDILCNANLKNDPGHKKTMKNIIKYLTNNLLTITDSYEKWMRVAFAISNSFTFDIGFNFFKDLCILDVGKYNETQCRNLLINCYEHSRGEISFNTIIYLAVETGFKYKNINTKST